MMDWAKILDFAFQYRWFITLVAGAGIYVALDWRRAMDKLRETLLGLMLQAEKYAKEQAEVNGPQLMDMVVEQVMLKFVPALPPWVRQFVTEELVRKVAQFLYDKTFDFLDDGKFNNSIIK